MGLYYIEDYLISVMLNLGAFLCPILKSAFLRVSDFQYLNHTSNIFYISSPTKVHTCEFESKLFAKTFLSRQHLPMKDNLCDKGNHK